jgi:hypothetical protein
MVARSACSAVVGACLVVAIGCGSPEPQHSTPAAAQAGGPGPVLAGTASPPTRSIAGAAGVPNLPTTGTPQPSAAGASGASPIAGTRSVTQPSAAGVSAAGAGGMPQPSAAGAGAGSMPQPSAAGMQAGSAGAGTPAVADGRIPCDVAKILLNRCRSCHGSPTNLGAPMSLVTWADLQRQAVSDPSRKVYELVAARVQDATRPMPPAQDGKVAANDKKLLVDWCNQGAPSLPSSASECP